MASVTPKPVPAWLPARDASVARWNRGRTVCFAGALLAIVGGAAATVVDHAGAQDVAAGVAMVAFVAGSAAGLWADRRGADR
jgi:hypothetical protein